MVIQPERYGQSVLCRSRCTTICFSPSEAQRCPRRSVEKLFISSLRITFAGSRRLAAQANMQGPSTARTKRIRWRLKSQGVSIQVAILKVLTSHGSGRATTASLKKDIAILTTSGPEWNARTRRLAGRVGTIDILASGLVMWDGDGWQITAAGRDFFARAGSRDAR